MTRDRMGPDRVEIATLLERLTAARCEGDAIASDGDDTLWRGDIGEALFEAALETGALRPAAEEALAIEAERVGVQVGRDATATARALYAAHRAGRYSGAAAYPMMAWCFAGFGEAELDDLAEAVLDGIGFDDAVRGFTRPLLAFAARYTHPFFLVSASPAPIVRAAARRLGIDASRCVAMEPALESGLVAPRLAGEPTYADGKVRRLREHTQAALLAAFGDSLYDAALLAEARIGVAVAPKPELEAALASAPLAAKSLVLEA